MTPSNKSFDTDALRRPFASLRFSPPVAGQLRLAIQPAWPDSGPKKLVLQGRSVGGARAAHDR